RVQVDQEVGVPDAADLGVAPGDLVVVESDHVGVVAPEADDLGLQLEALPLIRPFDDEQRGHNPAPPRDAPGHPRPATRYLMVRGGFTAPAASRGPGSLQVVPVDQGKHIDSSTGPGQPEQEPEDLAARPPPPPPTPEPAPRDEADRDEE